MRALQYDRLGDPEDVLALHDVAEPHPGPGQVRVRVAFCGLNPADWALCEGLFPDQEPPCGIGLEVSGTVDEVGEGVPDDELGRLVLGPVPHGTASAGAAELAVLATWTAVPEGLDLAQAAALPMAAETATRCVDLLGVAPGETLLVHGAGSVIGRMAAQLALHRGVRVIATAGPRNAASLRASGAQVTTYGDGMVDRVRDLAGGPVDRAFDSAPVAWAPPDTPPAPDGVLPDLVAITGDPDRVLTVARPAEAARLGVRNSAGALRIDALPQVAALAARGAVDVPIAGSYPLAEFGETVRRSRSMQAGGKLLLVP
ncbi:NADP-dependent oxidoreductase [Actinomycetospora corticicola]|uniref:NADPH:quinone reductase-like Zn-dependent oxidoreductase n=1 Tax=Actinomycetospora corticicola TaxID=663602 RepID=A0A7Y9DRC4_9PSEU|nr:NADP-dependent oxidoreductase [Actinomycetospora corticicola]NYD34111.1 NADPH:quinone reductase-like Zn-dependent oxidoreductase [Actinomycetospora corticicola]